MFYPGKQVMEVGSSDFPNARSAMNSPLAKALYGIDDRENNTRGTNSFATGITRVFFGSDFITVTKSDDVSWDILKPEIFAELWTSTLLGSHSFLTQILQLPWTQLSTKKSFLLFGTITSFDKVGILESLYIQDDSETVAMIKELLETRIRPAVQDDGGDIEYRGFDPYHHNLFLIHMFALLRDTGIVKLRMQGACSGCPSSSVTLKSGIENMLMHYVPEVNSLLLHSISH
ncbi:hypothetical protein C3L33_02694, partial [Rhododendron williamsianum]